MAHKRKHHSKRKKMHHLYREADRMDRSMDRHREMEYDREREHDRSYHMEPRMGRMKAMSDHPKEPWRGYKPRNVPEDRFEAMMNLNEKMRVMYPNNGRDNAPIREDFSRPCGIPYGALQRDLGNGEYYSMNAYRVGDLYEQVDATMRQDADAISTITKPTNW